MFGDSIMKLNVKNIINFLQLDNHVDKRGFLHKKGEVNKGWQRRWFLLKGNMLFYYVNPHDTEPIGLVILEGCSINTCSSDNTTFSITFQGDGSRVYHLSADDEETCASWISALQRSSYGYLYTQVQRLREQVSSIENKKNMYLGRSLTLPEENAPSNSTFRSGSLTAPETTINEGQRSPKPKHGLRAFSSPFTHRKKAHQVEGKRSTTSPSRCRKQKDAPLRAPCRSFEQLHRDFAPGQPVIVDGAMPYKYKPITLEGEPASSPSGLQ